MATQSGGLVKIKRGYLFDKKGILDRKRWYVLCNDVSQGSCLIEIFKDEKAAARMESPKGFINVHDIVKVHRITERKQSFEILCPGLGYRFMANSDVEADEWVYAIQGLILYRKEPALGTSPSSLHTQPVAITPPHHHTLPSSLPDSGNFHLSPSSSSYPLHNNLPTPPDLATSPATLPSYRTMNRGRDNGGELGYSFPPPPSPPSSSSESSSMASGSNASYDQPLTTILSENDTDFRFRVQVKESEGLAVSGAADLVLGDNTIALYSPDTGHLLVSWPIAALRRYGINNVSLTIVTGRNCSTGEGKYQFYTQHSRRVYSHLHAISKAAAAAKTYPLRRTGSEPPALANHSSTHYNHIDHPLTQPTANEEYSRLNFSHVYGLRPKPHPSDDGQSTNQSLTSSTLC